MTHDPLTVNPLGLWVGLTHFDTLNIYMMYMDKEKAHNFHNIDKEKYKVYTFIFVNKFMQIIEKTFYQFKIFFFFYQFLKS